MGSEIYFTKEHDMVRKAVRDFVNKEINPYVDECEEKGIAPLHGLFKKMGDLGFLEIRFNPKYGGEGLDYWYELVVLEELGHIKCGGIPMASAVGTAVVVSHDRWFLDRICTHILAFEGDSQARLFLGNWSDYEAYMREKVGKDISPHRIKYRALKR